jgi:hypothetical protein
VISTTGGGQLGVVADRLAELEPVQVRHVDVGHHQGRPMLAHRGEPGRTVGGHHDIAAEAPDDLGDDPLVIEVVLGYHDESHSRRINPTNHPASGICRPGDLRRS